MKNITARFLTNTDQTGRFIVTSAVTGRKYFVEPIDGNPVQWGDVNPATKKVEGDYGDKYKGSVSKEESLLTEENGFIKIDLLAAGSSPYAEIERRDKEYELLGKK
tara:strand:+ start:2035 stop:2352 length:318 start_codon:yes stop_codon:yes gene_type:complete